ncbi:hypothetical protein [Neobacillus sp. NPDC093127]|uniref:hypothetical protein n=1 Tax=Neobacillus sp. NPDC093127 TaxID=3364296 RepID=UPI003827B3A1
MQKKWTIALLLLGIGFLCIGYITAQQKQTIGYGGKIFDIGYDSNISEFSGTNSNIQYFILNQSEGAFALGPLGVDYYKSSVDNMILNLQRFTDEMEQTSVPKPYKQAHDDLLRAYQNFIDAVTVYRQAINKDGITTSNIDGLFAAYPQITLASEKWYTIYKKRVATPKVPDRFRVIGNLQDRMLYINSTQSQIGGTLDKIKSSLLPWVDTKDYNGVHKMQGNLGLPSVIFYMKNIKVPESYSTAHQHLLSACENFYNFIKDTQYQQINDDYLEKLKGYYENIEKAWEEWTLVEGS